MSPGMNKPNFSGVLLDKISCEIAAIHSKKFNLHIIPIVENNQ